MNKLIKLIKRNECCKGTRFLTRSCYNPNICFNANHNLGLASYEIYINQPVDGIGNTYVIPIYIGYVGSDRYLSYSITEYQPVSQNRVYRNGSIYKYIEVNENGKILNVQSLN